MQNRLFFIAARGTDKEKFVKEKTPERAAARS
jgi:hypothetical protein